MIIKSLNAKFMHVSRLEYICIFLLLFVTIITRMFLILNTPFFYAQDAYSYLYEAREFAHSGTIKFKVGMPFIFLLGVFIKIFGIFFGEIYASRLFMVLASVLMIITIYKIGQKMSDWLLGLLAGLLAVFEPYCIKYSTVPYLEVFAISMGLLALYFTLSDKKLHTILAPIFFYLAVFTRTEYYLPLVISIVIAYFYKNWKTNLTQETKGIIRYFFVFTIYLLPFFIIFFYAQSWGAFSLIQRIALFLTPDLLLNTVESSFNFYNQQLLNQVIYLSVMTILILNLLKNFISVSFKRKGDRNKISVRYNIGENSFFSDGMMTAFCFFLLSLIYIFVLTIFSYGYNWAFYVALSDMTNISIIRKAVIITPSLHDRYLILLRLLISYSLAYPFVLAARKTWISIHHIRNKVTFIRFIVFLTILFSLYTWHNISMWQIGLAASKDASTSMGTFVEASEWLSEKLDRDEIAIVPSIEIFLVLNSEFDERLVNYKLIWDSAGIAFHERSDPEKLQKLHNYFNNFLKKNPDVKYLVRDWVDPYARYLFENNNELVSLINVVKTIPFTLNTGWSDQISIYEFK